MQNSEYLKTASTITRLAGDDIVLPDALFDLANRCLSGRLSHEDAVRKAHALLRKPLAIEPPASFDPFKDYSLAGYLRNVFGAKDTQAIKCLEHFCLLVAMRQAASDLAKMKDITYQSFKSTHKSIFGSLYPWAGQDRLETAPGLTISVGQPGSAGHTVFAPATEIALAVEYGLSLATSPAKFKAKCGTAMGYFAYAHPFLDGNGRTLMLVHMELCRRNGILVNWDKISQYTYLIALSKEVLEPERHLDKFLADYIN